MVWCDFRRLIEISGKIDVGPLEATTSFEALKK